MSWTFCIFQPMKEQFKKVYNQLYKIKLIKVIVDSVQDFINNDSSSFAAATAFYTIFSLPAFFIIILNIGSYFYNESDIKDELFIQIEELAGKEAVVSIEDILENFTVDDTSFLSYILAVGVILFSATTVFVSLQRGINHIWHLKTKPETGIIKQIFDRLWSFSVVFSLGFILVISLLLETLITIVLSHFNFILDHININISNAVQLVVAQLATIVIFTLMYRVLPDARVKWKDTWIGAIVTTILFALGKYGIGLYLGNSDLGNTYGAAGSLVILLIWVYYSVLIFLFGGQITYYIATYYGNNVKPKKSAMMVELKEVKEFED